MERTSPLRFGIVSLLVLAVTVAVGLIHLPHPFSGDQALFTQGALELSHGKSLYADFWDLKPPGIYLFYLAGGTMFGFDEVGIHLFELLYWLAFAVVLQLTLRSWVRGPWTSAVAPLLTVVFGYSVSDEWHLTQIESLVGFPLFLSMWLTIRAPEWGRVRYAALLATGVLDGMVLMCKPMYLLLIAGFWGTAILRAVIDHKEWILPAVLRVIVPVSLGVALPLLAVAGWLHSQGSLSVAYQTIVELPPRILAVKTGGYAVLMDGLQYFTARFSLLMALGLVGAVAALRRERDWLTINLVIWFVLGMILIFLQRMWWQYHYLLIMVPVGLLALKGLDAIWEQVTAHDWSRVAAAALVLLFLWLPFSFAVKTVELVRANLARTPKDRLAYQCRLSEACATARREAMFLRDESSRPGDVYVFGDPLFYHVGGRRQAINYQGWSLWYMPEQWQDLARRLHEARPAYVFIAEDNYDVVAAASPETMSVLNEVYRPLRRSDAGRWFEACDP